MGLCKVTAIIRSKRLEAVEQAVLATGIHGLSISRMKGCGEYKDFFHDDFLTTHTRLEVFTSDHLSRSLVNAIMDAAHTGEEGDGVIAVSPVSELHRIRTRSPADENEL